MPRRRTRKIQSSGDAARELVSAFIIGDDLDPVRKALTGEGGAPRSNVSESEDIRSEDLFEKSNALHPPYDPNFLITIFEHSNALRPNIDAYCVNIDGHGHRLEPVLDVDEDGADEVVRNAIIFERLAETQDVDAPGDEDPGSSEEPTDAEVEERIEQIRREMSLEKSKLQSFFDFATVDESFVQLRRKTRLDMEIIGWGAWEVLRNAQGEPCQFNYIPGFTLRLRRLSEPMQVQMRVKRTEITYDDVEVWRRFRTYVQALDGSATHFKDWGDPRVISSKTGKVYTSEAAMRAGEDDEDVRAATEILYFPLHWPRSPYGMPRWVGVLLSVLGSRQSEEVNFLYFDNKSVPPLAVLVSGGRLAPASTERIKSYVQSHIKGRGNFHSILVIEADPASNAGALDASQAARTRIEIVPLNMAQHDDGLFQKYDERNIDKVGMAFRLPRLLRGDIRDFNRATADSALDFAETQVFSPERQDFDWIINRHIVPALGIRYWRFVSNSATSTDPEALSQIVTRLVMANVLTPSEAREISEAVVNRSLAKLDEVWTRLPPGIAKQLDPHTALSSKDSPEAALVDEGGESSSENDNQGGDDSGGGADDSGDDDRDVIGSGGDLKKLASRILMLRQELRDAEQAEAQKNFDDARELEEEVIRIPADEFAELLRD